MYTFKKFLFGVFPVAGAAHWDRAQPAGGPPASLMRQTGQLAMDLDLTSQLHPTFGALGERQNSAAITSTPTSSSTAGAVCGYLQGSSGVWI